MIEISVFSTYIKTNWFDFKRLTGSSLGLVFLFFTLVGLWWSLGERNVSSKCFIRVLDCLVIFFLFFIFNILKCCSSLWASGGCSEKNQHCKSLWDCCPRKGLTCQGSGSEKTCQPFNPSRTTCLLDWFKWHYFMFWWFYKSSQIALRHPHFIAIIWS